jgi:hypothetical protein
MTQTIQISHQQTNKNKKLGVLAHDRNTQGNTTKQNKREASIAEASTLMQGLQCLCRDFSAYVGASVLTWGLQYLHGGFSTYAEGSVLMQGLQYLCQGFSTYALASVLTHWLQYLRIGFSTYALASVLTHWLQYLRIGFSTYALASVLMHWLQYLCISFSTYTLMLTHNTYPLMPTHLCLLTYAYSLMPTHNAPTMLMPTRATGALCRRHEKDLVFLKLGARFETLCNGSRDISRTDRAAALSTLISQWVGKPEHLGKHVDLHLMDSGCLNDISSQSR